MSEQDKTSLDQDALRPLLEAARGDASLADFLIDSRIEPLDRLSDQARERLGRGFEVGHSPIIITDGSVRMNLSSEEYRLAATLYTSTDLTLLRVESTVSSHSNGSNVCYSVRDPNEVCTVVFHCAPENGGGGENNIVVQGGLLMSPIISFDPTEFVEVLNPPPERKIHNSAGRRIVAMEIFSTLDSETRRVHLCPLAGDGCEYRIVDEHRVP
ncbi:MAG TPA: hypothetical protein VD861_02220 [Pyrinomonadaceae bacterium]|nr:hypothetical protein [Pyrinomonadaceae bacterium]